MRRWRIGGEIGVQKEDKEIDIMRREDKEMKMRRG
jgi:hypothetical protein